MSGSDDFQKFAKAFQQQVSRVQRRGGRGAPGAGGMFAGLRSEERRVWKKFNYRCISRWSP